ncbi:MAG: aminoglycoside phosphotransferase family protein [Acidimicrobiia bacterium]
MTAPLAPYPRGASPARELALALAATADRPVELTVLGLRSVDQSASHRIEELEVRLDDGRELHVFAKDLSDGGLLPDARLARAGHLSHPWREIVVYRELLDPAGGGAGYLGAYVEDGGAPAWLFLERVAGLPLTEVGAIGVWGAAAAELARLHAAGMAAVRPCRDWTVHLVRGDDAGRARALVRAVAALERGGRAAEGRTLRAAHERAAARLAAVPVGVTHGDCYPANVLVRDGGSAAPVIVDWEDAGIGPVLLDVAALTSGARTDAQRSAIADAYRRAACSLGFAPPTWSDPVEFEAGLAACRYFVCVEHLGAPVRWSPPEGQRHDWLRDACATVDVLV